MFQRYHCFKHAILILSSGLVDTERRRELTFMGHFSILLPDAVGLMVADEPPEDLFEAGWLFLRDLADRIEDVSESDEEAGEHWRMLTEV